MKTTKRFVSVLIGFAMIFALLSACGSKPAAVSGSDELDAAIRETSDYLNNQLPKGNKLVILNIQSEYPALSEYIIDELIANTVNDRVFTVVDRQQLNTIRAEQNFQMSGEVSDESAQAIGQMFGAQIIVSGAVSKIGDLYRLRIRALTVQSAEIAAQFNKNIPNGPTVLALVDSKATGYGSGTATASAPVSTPAAQTQATATATVAAPAPAPTPIVKDVYKIGETGPAGGIVFYDKGNNSGGWRYLKAASSDLGKGTWGQDVAGTKTNIGSGKQNTSLMRGMASTLCLQYEQGGYRDWFLPSKDELDLMFMNLKIKGLGRFVDDWYWSSSNDVWEAWTQNFSDGKQNSRTRDIYTLSVRAIRQF